MKTTPNTVEKIFFFTLLFVSLVGPWTPRLAIIFGLSEFENNTVSSMILFLLKKMPISLGYGAPYFIGVPMFFILLRACFGAWASRAQKAILIVSMAASIVSVFFLWIPLGNGRRATENVMGDVFVGDVVTMVAVHGGLCIVGILPRWSFAFGPAFGLSLYVAKKKRVSSFLLGLACIYVNIGTLYRGYLRIEALGKEIFSQTVSIEEWYGYEIFAGLQVVFGFLLLCSSIPTKELNLTSVRGTLAIVETVVYVVLLNANIAFGWIASNGIFRGDLVRARQSSARA